MGSKVGRIRDVARETGLSIATVSRVVNGAKNVKADTRDKVLLACEKLDYVPNPAARWLSTNKTKTIAAIIPTIEHSVFSKYVTAIEKTLGEQNYSLVLAISNADPVEELKAARQLLGMGAEAFILSGFDHSEVLLDLFARRNVSYVFTSVWDNSERPVIGYDNNALAMQAVQYLKSQGHCNIAVIHGPLHDSDRTRARREGAAAANNGQLNLDYFEVDLSVEGGKKAVQSILASGTEFTAVLCFSDVLALGAYFALFETGMKIPDDISVMGFDNLDWSAHAVPPLTTIDLPAEKMGIEVANQLIDKLQVSKPIERIMLPAGIIQRQSVRKIES